MVLVDIVLLYCALWFGGRLRMCVIVWFVRIRRKSGRQGDRDSEAGVGRRF